MADEARARASLFLFAAGLAFAGPSAASEWRLEKGFGASASYSDAADANDGGTGGESVLALNPFVRLEVNGLRSELSLSGAIELQRFVDQDRVEVDPLIFLASRTTLVESFADIDALARVSRRSVRAEPLVGEELARFDETEETYEISIGPTITGTLGSRTDYDARYRFATARGSGDGLVGSDVHAASLRVAGTFGNGDISIGGDYELARFESDEETRSGSIGLGAGYGFSPALLATAAAGYDRVETDDTDEFVDGEFWDVGLRWRPSRRLQVRAGYGERAYGRKPSASITLTGRRSTIEFSWSRDLAFATGTGFDVLASPLAPESDGTADANGTAAEGAIEGAAQGGLRDESRDGGSLAPLGRDAGQVDEIVDLFYSLSGRRSTFSTSLRWVRRERLDDTGAAASGLEYGLGFRRVLSRRIEADASWTAIENELFGERERTRENRFRLSVTVML